eukprot:CAMPEP_0183730100 /NCGR_PEP_ID=MMETSP0737-20130205/31983_1 /TAXON_ID=385413 /ORGANISM="Thalassiosira miniscula, Strain CCMP1093" /LENGTH=461 /DNA_ID=CAMNT_0025962489 /DNA_START=100 /DNA_END=1485 /DNA_ORIENTATION=+
MGSNPEDYQAKPPVGVNQGMPDNAIQTGNVDEIEVPPSAPNATRHADDEGTYIYRDFATIPAPSMSGATLHPQSLQAQKLPAKLASILSDQGFTSLITWLPHGRSWKVLNRDLFAEHALPSYFGHRNYASFVRIVNAWGFRRITRGPDRDAYYHELFLRGRPDLHQRMKRLSTAHRKAPVTKEHKCPNFYELAKTSPLPEISFHNGTDATGGNMMPNDHFGQANANRQMMSQYNRQGHGVPGAGGLGGSLGGQGNVNGQMLSFLSNDVRSMTANRMMNGSNDSLPMLAQLQRDNEDLKRRIMAMENQQGDNQRGPSQKNTAIPDQLANLSANIGGSNNGMLGLELERMMQHNNTSMPMMNGSMNNSALLSSLGGGGAQGNGRNEFSFMTGFPRDDMLLRAMRLDNQMGYLQQQQSSSAVMERARQQNNFGQSSSPADISGQGGQDGLRKAMMDFKQQQQTK